MRRTQFDFLAFGFVLFLNWLWIKKLLRLQADVVAAHFTYLDHFQEEESCGCAIESVVE